jgi:hypothetical protein
VTTFGLWQFTLDRDATIAAYARAVCGGSEGCSCNGCRNFRIVRERAFPEPFFRLLESLGIDYRKDGEVYHNARPAPGRHSYGGWFHFVGEFRVTGDFPVVPLGDGFSAWLVRKSAPELPALRGLSLVELDFQAENIPWALDEPKAT